MAIFRLPEQIEFPEPRLSNPDGLLAVGGDLSPERLIAAYSNGIFPWFSEGDPILWWSPDPRFILVPESLHLSQSMRQILKKKTFHFTADTVFPDVIHACKMAPRENQN